jgi:hypothetical protein
MRASEVSASLSRLQPVDGRWRDGAAEARFTAYFDGDRLVYLRETFSQDDRGVGNEYFFRADRLFFAREGASRTVGDPPRVTKTFVWVAFDEEGEVTGTRKRVDGEEVEASDGDAAAVRRRAGELAGAAQRARGSTEPRRVTP